jgi:nucleoside-diphosphate-sugar epimerase
MKSNVLILGGTGFIGRNLIKKLSNKYNIDCIHLNKLDQTLKCSKVNYVKFNLHNFHLYKNIFKKRYKYVINLSGYINHDISIKKKVNIFKEHFLITVNLIDFFINKKIKKFINIGSSDEYGNLNKKLLESDKENPLSIYSLAKTCSSYYLRSMYKIYGFPSVTLRIFLAYGPGQEKIRYIPYVVSKCLKDKKIFINNKNYKRDFCYIEDVVNAIILSMKSSRSSGEIFNVGSGTKVSLFEVAKKISNLCLTGKIVINKKKRDNNKRRENVSLCSNLNKIKKILKWTPKINLNQGLLKTIEYYKCQNSR